MSPIVSIGPWCKVPFGRLAFFIWAGSIVQTAVLAGLTAWMVVEQSDPFSALLAVLAVISLGVGREAWRFAWTR